MPLCSSTLILPAHDEIKVKESGEQIVKLRGRAAEAQALDAPLENFMGRGQLGFRVYRHFFDSC